jgi:hypothetical protein
MRAILFLLSQVLEISLILNLERKVRTQYPYEVAA